MMTLRIRLGRDQIDAWLTFWGCVGGGLALSCFAVGAVRQHAANGGEVFLGVAAATVTTLVMSLLGVLARRVHLAVAEGNAPWRVRRWEMLSHVIGVAVLGLAGAGLASTSPGMCVVVTGSLLILAAYTAILCLGCWSTLARPTAPGRG